MADSKFEIDVDVADGSVAPAAARLAALALQLTEAGAASEAASAAVKAGEAAYKQAEVAADRAAKALEKVTLAAEEQRGKMAAAMNAGDPAAFWRAAAAAEKLNTKQSDAAKAAEAAKAALAGEASALDKLKAAAQAATDKEDTLKKAHDQAKKATDAQRKSLDAMRGSGKFTELADGAKKLGGPLAKIADASGDAAEGFEKMTGAVGVAGSVYVVAAVAIVALSTAIIGATAALLKFAIANSDAARTSELLAAGIAQSESAGAELDDAITQLAKRVPQSREELRGMAADLAKTGLQGKALTDALEAAAEKASETKFGPQWSRQMTSLDKLAQLFRSHLGDIFKLNIEPLLDGLSKLVALFDTSSETGRAIKVVFQDVFQKLVDWLAGLAPKIVAAFIQFEIWALKALIAIKPYGSTFLTIGKIVGGAVLAIVGVLTVLVGIFVALGVASAAVVVGLIYLGSVIFGIVSQAVSWAASLLGIGVSFDSIKSFAMGLIDYLSGISLLELGTQIVTGLAQGITNAGVAVLQAITGVVGGAIDAAKGLLGIASPSRVFAQIGSQTAEGMAGGVDAGTSDVQGSIEAMVSPPAAQANSTTTNTTGASLNFAGAQFVFQGVAGAEDAEQRFKSLLTRLLEGDAASLGSEVPA